MFGMQRLVVFFDFVGCCGGFVLLVIMGRGGL